MFWSFIIWFGYDRYDPSISFLNSHVIFISFISHGVYVYASYTQLLKNRTWHCHNDDKAFIKLHALLYSNMSITYHIHSHVFFCHYYTFSSKTCLCNVYVLQCSYATFMLKQNRRAIHPEPSFDLIWNLWRHQNLKELNEPKFEFESLLSQQTAERE
jgi:hypothetical protein